VIPAGRLKADVNVLMAGLLVDPIQKLGKPILGVRYTSRKGPLVLTAEKDGIKEGLAHVDANRATGSSGHVGAFRTIGGSHCGDPV
jgi:hypothetical protein